MSTELWFRDPWNYIRELASTGYAKVTWNWMILTQKKINPVASAEMYFAGLPWELLCIGSFGATHYVSGNKFGSPNAVYPLYRATEPTSVLEHYLNNPAGQDKSLCFDLGIETHIRPVWGQEHRVVVTDIPSLATVEGKNFIYYLAELQDLFPEAVIHINGISGFNNLFGMGFGAADCNPRHNASGMSLMLPSGLYAAPEWVAARAPHYFEMFDYKPSEINTPKKCCIYNIRSAIWASEHYEEEVRYMVRKGLRDKQRVMINPEDASAEDYGVELPRLTKSYLVGKQKPQQGDKFACNFCSLQLTCKLFRLGAVCSVPGSDPVPLSRFFGTRDSGKIIDGLAMIVQGQANRLEEAMKQEKPEKGLDPEISKELTRTFQNGVKLAQLIDPNLRSGAKVQVNVNGGNAAIVGQANEQDIVATVVRQLELQGTKREDITPEILENALAAMAAGRQPLPIDRS